MKTCRECQQLKPLEEFHRDSHLPDGRRHVCKDCAKAKMAAYRIAEAERVQAYAHDYSRRPDVMERSRDFNRRRHEADRDAAFDHYGRECARCGSTDDLQINHVDGSGQECRLADP
jgi:protein-arginine kinase activator protein McsA